MKTISLRLEDVTVGILEEKAKEQNITISEYLRQQIFPLMEGTKPLTLDQVLAKLDACLSILRLCVKPLQELVFGLGKFEAELIIKQETQMQVLPSATTPEPAAPQEMEKKTDGQETHQL
jgi:hypothetical protein